MNVVAVIGLGYVGLPLAVAFAGKYRTIGFDVSDEKLESYRRFVDVTGEVSGDELRAATALEMTSDPRLIGEADYIIVAVPTPVDRAHQPNFSPLIAASITVGRNLKRGAIVVYESTVYPGATEELCIPVLERESGFQWKKDFHVGYSPERINPGDKKRTLQLITKVVAGDDSVTLESIAELYGSIIEAGIHKATSIQVAEAAKVIENTQRDLNVALMNELAIIFDRMGIDTLDVLEAAGTKWNFLPFRPGLVGGHCIGVDPYYLTHKAETLGYIPQVILAGRRINEGMGKFVAEQTIKNMVHAGSSIKGSRVIVLGLTFKEDCPDLRNSKVIDVIRELESYGVELLVHDPIADPAAAAVEYGITLREWDDLPRCDAIVAAVAHSHFRTRSIDELADKLVPGAVFIDVKSAFDFGALRNLGFNVWRL